MSELLQVISTQINSSQKAQLLFCFWHQIALIDPVIPDNQLLKILKVSELIDALESVLAQVQVADMLVMLESISNFFEALGLEAQNGVGIGWSIYMKQAKGK